MGGVGASFSAEAATAATAAHSVTTLNPRININQHLSCLPSSRIPARRQAGGRYRLVLDHGPGSLAYFYSGAAGSANADAIGSIILGNSRSEEHTSELQSLRHLVC